MAKPNPELINAIRNTAKKLEYSKTYQWGHMGSCNCGHLVQEVTKLTKGEIHEYAMRTRGGDWSEQSMDYCPTSGYLMDQVIGIMLDVGMDIVDFKHLERLSDKQVLKQITPEQRNLSHNKKEDVVKYLNAWATLLEEQLASKITIPAIEKEVSF